MIAAVRDYQEIQRLLRQGKSYPEIAARLGVSVHFLAAILSTIRAVSIDDRIGPYTGRTLTKQKINRIVKLRKNGLSFAVIADDVGIGATTVGNAFWAYCSLVEGRKRDVTSKKRALRDSDEILGLRRRGMTLAEIAQAKNLSIPVIGCRLYVRGGLNTKNTKPVHLDSQEVLRLRKEGKSFSTIGRILGVHRGSIAKVFRSMENVDPQLRKPIRRRANCDPTEVAALRKRGYPFTSIASLLKVSESTARQYGKRGEADYLTSGSITGSSSLQT